MKNGSILICCLFFCACQSAQFTYYSRNAGNVAGQKVAVLEAGGDVNNTRESQWLKQVLNNSGMDAILASEVSKKNPPKYVAAIGTIQNHSQSMKTVPVYGKTGIRSINTTSYGSANTNMYGTYNGRTNYGYNYANTYGNFNGYSNTNYYGNSNTTVDYDYGITGYSNVVVDNYLSCLSITVREFNPQIKDFNQLKTVHDSRICISDYATDDILLNVANDIISQVHLFSDDSAIYKCRGDNKPHICIRD